MTLSEQLQVKTRAQICSNSIFPLTLLLLHTLNLKDLSQGRQGKRKLSALFSFLSLSPGHIFSPSFPHHQGL